MQALATGTIEYGRTVGQITDPYLERFDVVFRNGSDNHDIITKLRIVNYGVTLGENDL
mgnify:CR=1 FL=1